MEDSGVTRRTVLRGTALGVLGAATLTGANKGTAAQADTAPLTLTVETTSPGHAVSPQLYGAFFEEINYAGVGGLYAELVRNRAFMDPATPDEFVAPADIPRVPGVFGRALQLNGGSPASYVLAPPGIVSGLTDFSVAAWVNPAATPNWSRVWDFGTGETDYMFLTVSAGGTNNPRFAITVSGGGRQVRHQRRQPRPASGQRAGRRHGLAAGGLRVSADEQAERLAPRPHRGRRGDAPEDPALPGRQLRRGRDGRHAMELEANDRPGLAAPWPRELRLGLLVRRRPRPARVPPARRGPRRHAGDRRVGRAHPRRDRHSARRAGALRPGRARPDRVRHRAGNLHVGSTAGG